MQRKPVSKLGIDTLEVLEAAGTKWNFLSFRPGLVGRHCISVDPYYLTHKAQEVGHHPDVILAGRRTNDGMGEYVANQVIRLMVRNGINPVRARVLVCAPWVDADEAKHEYGLNLTTPSQGEYDAVVVAVGHDEFKKLGAAGIRAHGKPGAVLYDVKYVLPRESVDGRL